METLDEINTILSFAIRIVALGTLACWFIAAKRAVTNGFQITLKGVNVTVKRD